MKTTGNYVLTPQGLVHKSRVRSAGHKGDAGRPGPVPTQILPGASVMRALSPNGWKASATVALDVPLGKMSVKFTVPKVPSRDGAVIYLFPGAENAQMRTILQPVLQWGNNGVFGGNYWSIACWHVSTDGCWYASDSYCVNAGDVVTGTVEAIQCSADACTWRIEAFTDKVRACYTVDDVPSLMLFVIGAALEAYPEDPCCTTIAREQYPASETKFTDIELIDLAGNRFVVDWNPRCDLGENSLCGCKNTVHINADGSAITLQY